MKALAPDSARELGELMASCLAGLETRRTAIGVIGLGYVGLPLACVFAQRGYVVRGFDIDKVKVERINAGTSYIRHIPSKNIAALREAKRFSATDDFSGLVEVGVIIICVPTPLTRRQEPDLSFVTGTAEAIVPHLRRGHLVVLESTTYPGTTREILRPILQRGGLQSGEDFFLAYSPEREDPGNPDFSTTDIPKVVGGDGERALKLVSVLYEKIVPRIVPVSSLEAAEAVKLSENIFRSVNIALVNELKVVYEAMGIDVWEIIDAAKTKPFGYMPFYPGPGLGGHCIPIDPFYLTWKAREFDITTRFIELAGEINRAMPQRVVDRTIEALSSATGKAPHDAHVLIVGIAYKRNVDDTRESPAFKIMELLERHGTRVSFYDPIVSEIPLTREYPVFEGRHSTAFSEEAIGSCDASIICTDHDSVDYDKLVRWSPLVIDTRNVCERNGLTAEHIVKA